MKLLPTLKRRPNNGHTGLSAPGRPRTRELGRTRRLQGTAPRPSPGTDRHRSGRRGPRGPHENQPRGGRLHAPGCSAARAPRPSRESPPSPSPWRAHAASRPPRPKPELMRTELRRSEHDAYRGTGPAPPPGSRGPSGARAPGAGRVTSLPAVAPPRGARPPAAGASRAAGHVRPRDAARRGWRRELRGGEPDVTVAGSAGPGLRRAGPR